MKVPAAGTLPLWIIAAALLASCAVTPEHPAPLDADAAWRTRVAQTRGLDVWEIKGRLGVRTYRRGGQATIIWKREGDAHNINLYGPLGGGRVVLSETADGAELRDNKKKTYYANDAETLLYKVAGWRVPFGAMKHWILGLPAQDDAFERTLDKWGRLSTLRQSGWEIQFLEYQQYDGIELPRKIFLKALAGYEHVAADRGDYEEGQRVEVRLVVKHWTLKQS